MEQRKIQFLFGASLLFLCRQRRLPWKAAVRQISRRIKQLNDGSGKWLDANGHSLPALLVADGKLVAATALDRTGETTISDEKSEWFFARVGKPKLFA
jgi:hypothetical protein